jgi:predicted phosphodiesterase
MNSRGERAEALRDLRGSMKAPVHFVRGNHEDFDWLAGLSLDPRKGTAPADPFDLFHYVPDGAVLERDGVRIAFLGGVEELPGEADIDAGSYQALLTESDIDIFVSHEGPYGSSTGYNDDTHGSRLITELVTQLQPDFHVFGHAHQVFGPEPTGRTVALGLDGLVTSKFWHPEEHGLKSGCLGVLDTSTGELRAITDDWLGEFPTPLDFLTWANEHVGTATSD